MHSWSDVQDPVAPHVVLLGASNIVRGLPALVQAAQTALGSPLMIFAAYAHGRSFGLPTCVLGKGFPPILECELWEALAQEEPRPTYAMITDIGNDIPYGASNARIEEWVEQCLVRLRDRGARVALSLLPQQSIARLRPYQLQLITRILFPRARLTHAEVMQRVPELNQRLRELAVRYQAVPVETLPHLYGLDPIHVTRSGYPEAWRHLLQPWASSDSGATTPGSRHLASTTPAEQIRRCEALHYSWFGRPRTQAQPACRLQSGTTLSRY